MAEVVSPTFFDDMNIERLIEERRFWFCLMDECNNRGTPDTSAIRTVAYLDALIREKNTSLRYIAITDKNAKVIDWFEVRPDLF